MKAHSGKKFLGFVWIGVAIALAGLFAGIIPILAKSTPWKWEQKAAELISENQNNICNLNPKSKAALDKLIKRIYPLKAGDSEFPISVKIEQNSDVNAYAYLGGEIIVFSELLKKARAPEELAGILAHEMGHVKHRHVIQGLFNQVLVTIVKSIAGLDFDGDVVATKALSLKFSRLQEAEADFAALERLKLAGVSAQGFIDFFKRIDSLPSALNIVSDHPNPKDRMSMAEKYILKNAAPMITFEEWKQLQNACSP
jgi:predicted Zn-dependent protease